jgi:heme exporter protein D
MTQPRLNLFSFLRWIAFVAAVLLVGVFLVNAVMNRRELGRKVSEFQAKGAEFGKLTDQAGCMQEGFLRSRSTTASEIAETDLNTSFATACLRSSRPTVDFCKDIPTLDLDEWKNAQCQKAGPERAQPGCLKMLEAKIDFCAATR